jgi:hypothetical protein
VRYAATSGVPVWWIHAREDRAPAWISNAEDPHDPVGAATPARDRLSQWLRDEMLPPPPVPRHRHTWITWASCLGQSKTVAPEQGYFGETPRRPRRVWRAYSTLMRWASRLNPPWSPLRPPEHPLARYWHDRYEPADGRAGEYASRYRSSYVWVFAFATMAVLFGALALSFGLLHRAEDATLLVASLEMLTLVAIVVVVGLSVRFEWHERSIEYRLLAELCRKQQVLAPLGRDIATGVVRRLSPADRACWVAWLYAAWQRAAPLPEGRVDAPARRADVKALIAEQIEYHTARRDMSDAAGHTFVQLGAWSFALVLVCVGLKITAVLTHSMHDSSLVLGLLATVLPGLSAAFVGIRAYAELQLLAEQSRHMLIELTHAEAHINRMNVGRAFAAQDLGVEGAQVATLMLQDLEGWARLFRVKGVEAG